MDREDSDCEVADVGADLEAMFGFELDVDSEDGFNLVEVVEALNGGANRRELEEIIEAGLAERLEYRLNSPSATPDPSGSVTPDVEARMTPPEALMTPDSPGVRDGFAEEVTERLRDAPPRRSSISHPAIVEAVEAANSKRRLSLTRWVSKEPDSTRAQLSARKAAQRHRQSIIKAAEVLEASGVSDCKEESRAVSVEHKLHLVQRAVEVAQRRHRQSVVRAVRAVTQPEGTVTDSEIERAVAAAYA
jgi:hypothetical protein